MIFHYSHKFLNFIKLSKITALISADIRILYTNNLLSKILRYGSSTLRLVIHVWSITKTTVLVTRLRNQNV
jgi:hypothetical protein